MIVNVIIPTAILLCVYFIFAFIDCHYYLKAPFPERREQWYFGWPGGGIAAYFLLTKDVKNAKTNKERDRKGV